MESRRAALVAPRDTDGKAVVPHVAAAPAAQPGLEVAKAHVVRPAADQQRRMDRSLVPALAAGRDHHMPGAQILQPERVVGNVLFLFPHVPDLSPAGLR
jgi:hypothetical protein